MSEGVQDLTLFNLAAIVLTLAAVFGYINHRWLRLPLTIGLVIIALTVSVCVVMLDLVLHTLEYEQTIRLVLDKIDFNDTLMKGMLSFLLFAGALHVDLNMLLRRKSAIVTMATVGVLISAFIVGYAVFLMADALGLGIPLIWCLVFGALISPTDPVAVLSVLRSIKVPEALEAKIVGESLFNDGVGVVMFTLLVAIATSHGSTAGGEPISALGVVELFLREGVGGIGLGLVTGFVAHYAMKSIDEYNLGVIITLALVTSTYSIALAIDVSGPIAVVVAGLHVGNRGTRFPMSEKTRENVNTFWSLLDEILNAVLFMLIGFEVIVISVSAGVIWLMVAAIPLVLFARFVAVAVPLTLLRVSQTFIRGTIPTLVWGGLRGGISVALALSLPDMAQKETILAVTYGVVVFSIVVQGLTFKSVIQRYVR